MAANTLTTHQHAQMYAVLRDTFGFSTFRPLQEEIASAILEGHDVFALLPTGGGKSLTYQLPALMLDGITVVVSPLIALMKDQVDQLTRFGVNATFINSSVAASEVQRRRASVGSGATKLLYVAPERLMQPAFLGWLRQQRVAMFAIDEAHCVSEWGHDFRPEYRQLRDLRALFPDAVVSAFTATATPQVQEDIQHQLGLDDARRFTGSFNRTNLYYDVRPKDKAADQIVKYVRGRGSDSGIVYCLTRNTTESIAAKLVASGIRASAYHAGLSPEMRNQVQDAFVRDRLQVVVATIAFGMGIDKPDVRFVIHHDLPKNLEGYYQESGRAGRDGDPADCVLLFSHGDTARHQFFIDQRPNDGLRNTSRQQLRAMSDWAESTECRRKALLRYFAEDYDGSQERCCDICEQPQTMHDYTIAAQMFLSCVKRTGERFGASYVVDVLRGGQAERILKLGHHQLSTWGIGRDRSKTEWNYIARALIRGGFAHQDQQNFNIVTITDRGNDLLFRGEKFLAPRFAPTTSSKAASGSVPVANEPVFQALRTMRRELAEGEGVPPYVVFSDATLRELAAFLPRTIEDLLAITGIGRVKAERYGEAVLDVLNGVGADAIPAARLPSTLPAPQRPRMELLDSVTQSLELFNEGLSIEEIADHRGLAPSTIGGHIEKALREGRVDDVDRLVRPERVGKVAEALEQVDGEGLRALRDWLGEGFSYDEIRFAKVLIELGDA